MIYNIIYILAIIPSYYIMRKIYYISFENLNWGWSEVIIYLIFSLVWVITVPIHFLILLTNGNLFKNKKPPRWL